MTLSMMPTVDIHAGAYNMRAQAVWVKNLIIRGENVLLPIYFKDKTADNMGQSGSLWHVEELLRLTYKLAYEVFNNTRVCIYMC